jgi:hypothetical protein
MIVYAIRRKSDGKFLARRSPHRGGKRAWTNSPALWNQKHVAEGMASKENWTKHLDDCPVSVVAFTLAEQKEEQNDCS